MPTQYDFGLIEVGQSTQKLATFTVENYGHGDATVQVAVTYPFSISFLPDSMLWDDENVIVGTTFAPTNVGKFTNRVDIYGGAVNTAAVWLLGESWIPHFILKWTNVVSETS